jgi:hypothetical protein
MSHDESSELQRLISLPEDALMIEIARQQGALGASSGKSPIELGRIIAERAMLGLRSAICEDDALRSLAENKDMFQIAMAIVALIPKANPYADSLTLAALFARQGLQVICEPIWQTERPM